jgi:hypothetical protein
MNVIASIGLWLQAHWVELGVGLWLLEQALRVLSKITPWKWDDNLVDVIAKVLSSVFPKKPNG